MRYRDDESAAFIRARNREMREIQRRHPWRHIWVRILAHCIIPALVVLAIGEAALYVHGRMPLTLPIPVDHGVGAPSPHVAR
jgi:hypothetical protein